MTLNSDAKCESTLMGSFCQKHIMFQLKKFQKNCVMALKCDGKFKGKLTCGLKNDIWLIFMQAVESVKNCTFISYFCPKHIKILMKKYRRVMFHDTEERCKF